MKGVDAQRQRRKVEQNETRMECCQVCIEIYDVFAKGEEVVRGVESFPSVGLRSGERANVRVAGVVMPSRNFSSKVSFPL